MRLAILSDIHGNLLALEAVIADMASRKPDLVINLGDCVSGPLWPKETFTRLMGLRWPTVRGNCDREVGTESPENLGKSDRYAFDRLDGPDRAWLASLPTTIEVSPEILAVHGTPNNDDLYLTETVISGQVMLDAQPAIAQRLGQVKQALILCGHSHMPRLVKLASGKLVLNPGSVGLAAYDTMASDGSYAISETGSPHARYAMVSAKDEEFTIEMIAVPYDHEHAARKAEEAGRPEWGKGIRTGMMR